MLPATHSMVQSLLAVCQAAAQQCPKGMNLSAAGVSASIAATSSSNISLNRSYHVARLASRGVISIQGEDAVQFLQGMTTNDMKPLEQPGAGPLYSVLLTAKGKYLHDLFAYSLPDDTQRLLLDVDAASVSSALQWLGKYKLRRKLLLEDVSSQYSIWAAFGGQLNAGTAGQWRQDPRLPELGLRGVFDAQQLPAPPAEAGGSSSRKQRAAGMSIVSEDTFRHWRFQHGVAEGDSEVPSGQVAPLECNLDALSGISYTKGCYIGQERNSYTHYRGIIRKRMMPVHLPGLHETTRLACPLPIVAAGDAGAAGRGKGPVGTLTGQVGDLGIAYMKITPALTAADGTGPPLHVEIEGSQQLVVAQRPQWWPVEWGFEEHPRSTAGP